MSGAGSFVERHGLWTKEQHLEAKDLLSEFKTRNIEVVRFSFPDQHGILRGKTLTVDDAVKVLAEGVTLTTTLLAKDTSHKTAFPVFSRGGGFDMPEMQGGADFMIVADPSTFRVLPWLKNTGWLLCDAYFGNGKPVPFATRTILRDAVAKLDASGYELLTGLEVEFHVFKVTDPHMRPQDAGQPGEPPEVELLSHGYQYLTELRADLIEPVGELLRGHLQKLGLPLRSLEVEYGPSQFEFTFGPQTALLAADSMILFRSAVKQILRRNGYHGTFMCRPRIPNVMSSGWHLHQSLLRPDGSNAFMPAEAGAQLSPVGQHYLGGLLAHARGSSALSTPTINGYKRYRPNSLAPDRVLWARDNRGAMLRVLGGVSDPATRIENRVGEPAANPYLYFASQVYSGLDGIARKLDPGPSADTPYESKAEALPATLSEALGALRADDYLNQCLGRGFVDYFCRLKESEIARFNLEVTEWEHREYFEMF
ncbi:MAG: glutamine synthetase family protein [Burkholderiales bacterium]